MSDWHPFSPEPPSRSWGINFGGGVNSTALLLEAHARGLKPEWVLFADTGSERPETYRHLLEVEDWCSSVGFPFDRVAWVRKDGSFESVHENASRTGYLPSKAYGLAGCTFKWKIQPMQRWRREHGFRGSIVAVGYDAGERARIQAAKLRACEDDERGPAEENWYPLVAWGLDRAACVEIVLKHGFEAVKSSCFVCPNMSRQEWEDLEYGHPALYRIALEIEAKAKSFGNAGDAVSLFRRHSPGQTCFCFADGGAE